MEDALEILDALRDFKTMKDSVSASKVGCSALDLLRKERTQPSIITFCDALDRMLGGGITLGKLTEFCGAPGMGKTQLGMQLAVNCQFPESFGGAEGEAIYIDTEGSFICERARDIATAAVHHLRSTANPSDEEQVMAAATFETDDILSRIHLFRVHTHTELIALCHLLSEFCAEHPKVKLVVVDSIAFLFRQEFSSAAQRTRLLQGVGHTLVQLATERGLAAVLMNQMTTKFGGDGGRSQLVPALGEVWGHVCPTRVLLTAQDGQRCARLIKSPIFPEQTAIYDVTESGIRDVWERGNVKRTRLE